MSSNNFKYQTLMANLLNIDTLDSSLFSSIDNEKYFDVLKNFGESTFDKIYNNFNINCVLTEVANRNIAEKVSYAKNKTEVVAIFKEYNKRIDDNLFKMLGSSFEKAKNIIISNQETEFQKSIVKWKKILNKAQNINIETNIWPLNIGFFYISIKTENKTIYAPLFFKEIIIEVKNSLVYLHSNSDIRVNSKLVTFLNQEGFSLNVDSFDFNNLSIKEVFEKFKTIWTPLFKMPDSLKKGIQNLTVEDIDNTSIEFHSGIVLGFYNVSSGYLWNQMKKIIENNEFDEILNPNFNKNLYREKVNHVIFDNKFKLFKIQETNFSQDVATVSSLYQDTIIWGPPGTGKSQTISNLIANIIARGYTALVVSQKKAALDVLRNRMKKLSIFCLFALNDKNLRQETFYEPLREFIHLLENYQTSKKEEGFSIFSDEDEKYVDNVNLIKETPNLTNIINFYSAIMNGNFSETTFENLKLLDRKLKYNFDPSFNDKKSIVKRLYETNYNKKWNIFTIVPKIIKQMAQIFVSDENLMTIDVNEALKYVNLVSFEEIEKFKSEYKKILINKTITLNDDKTIVRMLLEKTFEKMTNFTEEQKSQYTAFAMAIRTGHLKPYKFFHKHKEMIKILFPIIVTTPELDLSMWEKEEFDFAILDESSQMFIEKGIPILYLAKRKILSGDSQQMQPTRWFSATYNFDEEDDFGNIESLLDYAKARGVYSLLLDKNYRSKKATLMTFSSKHFYDSKLDVIDNYELSLSNDKAIEVFQVDGQWDNSMNVAEGEKVIELAKENLLNYNKIIILVFNVKQQEYLVNRIFGNEPLLEDAISSEKLVIKNIENIQGDEADLVIMSVVYDKNTALYNTYVARKGGKNALNVAISRAKEKVFVVKSIYADDIEITERSTVDMIMFKDWLKFLDLPLNDQKNYLDEVEDFLATKLISMPEDLKFKVDVLDELKKLLKDNNLEFKTNYSVGTKSIDIVLINKLNNKLVQGFILDNFSYKNDYRKYLIFKDNINFLESKEYPIITMSEIEWPIIKNKIFNYVSSLVEIELKTNQFMLNNVNTLPNNSADGEEFNNIVQPESDDINIVEQPNIEQDETKIEPVKLESIAIIDNAVNVEVKKEESIKSNIDEIDDYYVQEDLNNSQFLNEIDEMENQSNIENNFENEIDEFEISLGEKNITLDSLNVEENTNNSQIIENYDSLDNNKFEEPEEDEKHLKHLSNDDIEEENIDFNIDNSVDINDSKTLEFINELNLSKTNDNIQIETNDNTIDFTIEKTTELTDDNLDFNSINDEDQNKYRLSNFGLKNNIFVETHSKNNEEETNENEDFKNDAMDVIEDFNLVDDDEKTTEFNIGD
ncbi:DEAD/DEAH box helicase [Metamycoplasma gateae]|uniref:AAA domain-containing protein n=1 Tax=Metamycoplasma gateae TaxID=35769 RepID=A0ABZ2AHV3_9BACT|nr:AAA domain-containing protein [Metamycoplasma gateae]